MKIVINRRYGGYSLSRKAYKYLGIAWDGFGCEFSDDRTNPKLVACVEKLGESASGICAKLKVVEIPDGIAWEIDNYDGMESVTERYLRWS
jgi:hypothetical protein